MLSAMFTQKIIGPSMAATSLCEVLHKRHSLLMSMGVKCAFARKANTFGSGTVGVTARQTRARLRAVRKSKAIKRMVSTDSGGGKFVKKEEQEAPKIGLSVVLLTKFCRLFCLVSKQKMRDEKCEPLTVRSVQPSEPYEHELCRASLGNPIAIRHSAIDNSRRPEHR